MTSRSHFTKTNKAKGRDFPSYTTTELKSHLRNELTAEMRERIEREIANREAGISKPRVTPQVDWN